MFKYVLDKNLRKIMAHEKPYRKRPNEYPYDRRVYGHKYFKAILDDNGKPTEYHFFYYGTKLFIIYSNDVIEFCWNNYGQGETTIINGLCHGYYIRHEEARGGSLLEHRAALGWGPRAPELPKPEQFIVRKGMKYNMCTNKPVKGHEYEVHTHIVDRKKSAKVLKKHKELLDLINIWLQNVTYKDCEDLQNDIKPDKNGDWSNSRVPIEYAMVSTSMKNDLAVHFKPWGTDDTALIDVTFRERVKGHVRQRLYKQEKAFKTNVISWKEKRIPSNKNLEVKWLTKNWKSV
jgi:hypothetical protein